MIIYKITNNINNKIYIGQTTRTLEERIAEHKRKRNPLISKAIKKYGIEKPTLRIRDMETRWGSCLAKKRIITLNKRLLESPRNCIEYVVMHELCHLIHPNHSKQFYSFLTMLMPDWKERKIYLDKSAEFWL